MTGSRQALVAAVGEPSGRAGATVLVMRTDAELVEAVGHGDRGAFRELHDRHVVWLTSRLTRRCADRDVVAEAVQDTFVAVWKGAAQWNGRAEPTAAS